MTDQPTRSAEPAHLTNMKLGLATMIDLQDAAPGSPRMALLYGPSGYGKSVTAAFLASTFDAAFVTAKSIWTQRSLLEAIAHELGIPKLARTGPRLLEQITDQLLAEPRPLILDEMDHLVKKQSVEIIRDVHDATGVPVLMIGEESLPAKLKEWERFDNRILVATAAQPSSVADAQLLRDYYCARVRVADDLVDAILAATKGVTRRIVTNLQMVQASALAEGLDAVDLAAWGDRRFKTGAIAPRKAA